jgi:hypothetical protein
MMKKTKPRADRRGRREETEGMGGYAVVFMSEAYKQSGERPHFDIMMLTSHGAPVPYYPHGESTPRAGKERVVGKEKVVA